MKAREKTLPKDVVDWLSTMGFAAGDTPITEADIRMMCRANYLPIWEYLVTRVRTEREVDLVRANLALNGIDTGSNRGKVELEEEKRALQRQRDELAATLAQYEQELHSVEAETRNLVANLADAQRDLATVRSNCQSVSSRCTLVRAADDVLDRNTSVLAEYARRIELATAELHESEGAQQVEQNSAAAAAQCAAIQQWRAMLAEIAQPSETVDKMIEGLQTEHVDQWIALRASGQSTASLSLDALPDSAADLRALIAAMRTELEQRSDDRTEGVRIAAALNDRRAELQSAQTDMGAARAELERLVSDNASLRAGLKRDAAEATRVVRGKVIGADKLIEKLVVDSRGMLERELSAYRQSNPLDKPAAASASALRIHCSEDDEMARVLRMCIDRDPNAPPVETDSAEVLEMVATAQRAGAKHDEKSSETVATLNKACQYFESVVASKDVTESAYLDWKTLPAQYCLVDSAKRERYQRRVNHLRVIADELARVRKK